MRVKAVPEPPDDPDFVREARRAVPLVPGREEECVARLMDRADIPAQDAAREWLAFLVALGLAEETDTGVRRTRRDLDREALARAFREGIYGAEEALAILAASDGPLVPEEVFDGFREHVPAWERHRHADWRAVWRERVRTLLEWAVLLGLAAHTDEGYTA